jgi:hypothetical protein
MPQLRVLVVDDDEPTLQVVAAMLQKCSYRGESLLRRAREAALSSHDSPSARVPSHHGPQRRGCAANPQGDGGARF